MANELRLFQNYVAGRLLYDLPIGSTAVADGVTNGTTTITSATAAFTAADVGAPISGTDIPAGAYIAAYTNPTTVVLSVAATGSGAARAWVISREKVFHSSTLSQLSTIGTTQHQMVGLDPDGLAGAPEVVMVTKHDAAALWAQITRSQEGTAARAHAAGMDWTTSVLASDFSLPTFVSSAGAGIGPVSAETVIGTLVIPAQSRPYHAIVGASCYLVWSALDATAQWKFRIRQDSVAGAIVMETPDVADRARVWHAQAMKETLVAAGAAKTFVSTIARVTGANSASTFVDGTSNRIGAHLYGAV